MAPHEMNPECAAKFAEIQAKLDRAEEDLVNHRNWRKDMTDKLDNIHARITKLEVRIYMMFGGLTVLTWAFEHWFGPGKP